VDKMDIWDGTLLEAAALDLEFHRTLWRVSGNPYLERALNAVMVPLFAHKTLEHVTRDVRRWRMSHHRILLDAVAGRSGDDPQTVLLPICAWPIPSRSAIPPWRVSPPKRLSRLQKSAFGLHGSACRTSAARCCRLAEARARN